MDFCIITDALLLKPLFFNQIVFKCFIIITLYTILEYKKMRQF